MLLTMMVRGGDARKG